MVYRVYVEKRPELAQEAQSLLADLRGSLQIDALTGLRLINRYDVEHIDEALFERCVQNVFSEPQVDRTYAHLEHDGATLLAVEYLPGQFDQRADSAAQCIQILAQCERPTVRTAKIYALYGALSEQELAAIRRHLINPVESREATLDRFETLDMAYAAPAPVPVLAGFRRMDDAAVEQMLRRYGLAMDADDLRFCRDYFVAEQRDPTLTELKMIDTYWSDHCRHTTFSTTIDAVTFEDPLLEAAYGRYLAVRRELGRTKPINLMDIATIATRYLKAQGRLPKLDESEEINACTVKMTVTVDGEAQPWLLLFKNETHNHPTEIEPFGGAATCIGGAIRDPLSGRSYVYAAMRVTGAGDPLVPVSQTIPGKLPQKKLVTTAAAGYSSYGNQIGLATGMVDELYHPGYVAKRMEIGAVIAAAPAENVRRERPEAGDVVILLGGRTGRDGIGGATGSSKSHTAESLTTCGAEVQKGNAPEERKLQRLFRSPEASKLIKRCNDFGAGGVSVAIGELADGLEINLNAVPKKYEGLDGTELAISESQERMAVVVAAEDAPRFQALAREENLESTIVAVVTEQPRLVMRWNGETIVDVSREFLNSNGAEKHIRIAPAAPADWNREVAGDFEAAYRTLAADLNVCSKQGLSERFDSTIGAGTVLMPFGGRMQRTPIQAMVQKISLEHGHTDDCSLMAWGYNPYLTEKSPYHGAYLAVVESVSKLIAAGAGFEDVYLTFQEYFPKPRQDAARWGLPLAALLGALDAQLDLGIAAIGGKDSMSGSFEKIDVPPTLVSFAVTTGSTGEIVTPEFKQAGDRVVWLRPACGANGLPTAASLLALFARVTALMRQGSVRAAWTPAFGGVAEGVMKMCFGNGLGFDYAPGLSQQALFGYAYGSFVLELAEGAEVEGPLLGVVSAAPAITCGSASVALSALLEAYENKLEPVYPNHIHQAERDIPTVTFTAAQPCRPSIHTARPRVLIPVFPGTNCEYDSARAFADAGAEPEIFVINNLSADSIRSSVRDFATRVEQAQIVFIPGGFSGGDEPDGSGKFITAFFRSGPVCEAVTRLLEQRDGLMGGICNGFQALIKLGLVPYGKIREAEAGSPTLTFNTIGRHQSKIVRTRVASNQSPWLLETQPGEIYSVAISHGEGRFLADESLVRQLAANGQIMTQYVDLEGRPSCDVRYNPNDSVWAVEGILSPDGRVFGKMGHSERVGSGMYQNVPGNYDMGLFRSAVKYYR